MGVILGDTPPSLPNSRTGFVLASSSLFSIVKKSRADLLTGHKRDQVRRTAIAITASCKRLRLRKKKSGLQYEQQRPQHGPAREYVISTAWMRTGIRNQVKTHRHHFRTPSQTK